MTAAGRTPGETPVAGSKAARTRQRILAAAARELARHGYGGTSLRSVAAGAGLGLGSLYFHFSSKDELVATAMREGVEFAYDRVRAALDDLPSDTTPQLRLRTAIRAHLEALHASRDRAAAVVQMAETLPAELRTAHSAHERRYGRLWLAILQRARDEGLVDDTADPRLVRDLFMGALNSTLRTVRRPDQALEPIVAAAYAIIARPEGTTGPHR